MKKNTMFLCLQRAHHPHHHPLAEGERRERGGWASVRGRGHTAEVESVQGTGPASLRHRAGEPDHTVALCSTASFRIFPTYDRLA